MKPLPSAKSHDGVTLRQAALIAGAAYLLNPVSYAEFSIYPKLAPEQSRRRKSIRQYFSSMRMAWARALPAFFTV
jgi:hypothetical protein